MNYGQFYFAFTGRISRSDLWLRGILPSMLISIGVFVLDALIGANSTLIFIWNVLVLWPTFALLTKRLHDRNRTGWWMLLYAVWYLGLIVGDAWLTIAESPLGMLAFLAVLVVNFWLIIEMLFLKGTNGDNRFGQKPAALTDK